MTYCKASINGRPEVACELHIETERIDVTMATLVEPDPNWQHTDQQGHYHAWSADGELPTLTARSEHRYCDGIHHFPVDDLCEGYDVTLYACSLCGEDIEPGTVTRHGVPKTIPGLQTWTVVAYDVIVGRDPVSLRVETGAGVVFGFAVPTDVVAELGAAGPSGRTTLVGTSPLGRLLVREDHPA